MLKDRVSIIVPAFNEEKNIGFVISDLVMLRKKYNLQIIVVDDKSQDETYTVAKKAGADIVVSHIKNIGKGGAFRTGLSKSSGDYIVQIDADGQLLVSDIPLLIDTLKQNIDVVLGARYSMNSLFSSQFTSQSKMFGNLFVSIVATLFAGQPIIDVMTGLKGFRKNAVMEIIPKANDFAYEAELVIKAAKKKHRIKTVQISCIERKNGKSSLNSIKHGMRILKTIAVTSFL